jgi:hypothetical protein
LCQILSLPSSAATQYRLLCRHASAVDATEINTINRAR